MVVRDIDVLKDVAAAAKCTVCMSVPSVDEDAWRKMEPGTAHPFQRLKAVRALTRAGIRAGVLMAPLVPGITTARHGIEATLAAIADHGASFVGANVLHLEGGTRDHFFRFLERTYPHLSTATRASMRTAPSGRRRRIRRPSRTLLPTPASASACRAAANRTAAAISPTKR